MNQGDSDKQAPLRLVLMGTGPFAVPSFEKLREAGHTISLVVTRPQPPVKSRKGAPPTPVRQWALDHSFELFDPDSINTPEAIDRVTAANADLLVVCDYGQILKPDALAAAPLGGINLHGSLLPAYRGAAPVQRALLSGDLVTGVTIIHMTPKLDGGPVIATLETPIGNEETAGELEERLSEIGVQATLEAIDQLIAWDRVSPIGMVQDQSKVSKAPRLHKAEAEIDWARSVREIDCHVRGMQPWPVAFTHVRTQPSKAPIRVQVKQVRLVDPSEIDGAAVQSPGQTVSSKEFLVSTGDGILEIVRLQPAGKKEMAGGDFLRGHQLAAGTKLGSESG